MSVSNPAVDPILVAIQRLCSYFEDNSIEYSLIGSAACYLLASNLPDDVTDKYLKSYRSDCKGRIKNMTIDIIVECGSDITSMQSDCLKRNDEDFTGLDDANPVEGTAALKVRAIKKRFKVLLHDPDEWKARRPHYLFASDSVFSISVNYLPDEDADGDGEDLGDYGTGQEDTQISMRTPSWLLREKLCVFHNAYINNAEMSALMIHGLDLRFLARYCKKYGTPFADELDFTHQPDMETRLEAFTKSNINRLLQCVIRSPRCFQN